MITEAWNTIDRRARARTRISRGTSDGVSAREGFGQSFARVGVDAVAGACDDGFVTGVLQQFHCLRADQARAADDGDLL
jgi:hypothetical protein